MECRPKLKKQKKLDHDPLWSTKDIGVQLEGILKPLLDPLVQVCTRLTEVMERLVVLEEQDAVGYQADSESETDMEGPNISDADEDSSEEEGECPKE